MKYSEKIDQSIKALKQAGFNDDYRLDLMQILEEVSGIDSKSWFLRRDEEMQEPEKKRFDELAARLYKSEPVSYITGKRWFCGLEILVSPSTLIPRQETELLVCEAVDELSKKAEMTDNSPEDRKLRILDLCTGSGCIIVSLAKLFEEKNKTKFDKAEYYASDISPEALEIAEKNAKKHGVSVKFICGDMFRAFEKGSDAFDIIISNPPYIPKDQMEELDKKVRDFEPENALYGGEDGLDFYRDIAENAAGFLKKDGSLFLEIGFDQGISVPALLKMKGYRNIYVKKDYSGHDRIVAAIKA